MESCGDGSDFVGGGNDSGEGIARVVEILAGSVKRHARARWLCPLNRCYVVRDHRGLHNVIRRGASKSTRCITYLTGPTTCVAIGYEDGMILAHNVETGEEGDKLF
jgi:hypothetical protein